MQRHDNLTHRPCIIMDRENRQLKSQISDTQKLKYGQAILDWWMEKDPREVILKVFLAEQTPSTRSRIKKARTAGTQEVKNSDSR